MKKSTVLSCFFILFLFSCTVQKRTFNKGYFVQWNSQKQLCSTASSEPKLLESSHEEKNVLLDEFTDVGREDQAKPGLAVYSSDFSDVESNYSKKVKQVFVEKISKNQTISKLNSPKKNLKSMKKRLKIPQSKEEKVSDIVSVILFVLAVLFFAIAIPFILVGFAALDFFGPLLLSFGILLFLIALLLLVLGISLKQSGKKTSSKRPNYRGK